MKILLIDNYDSFTFNLFQILRGLGAEVTVRLNDQVPVTDIESADALVISPGPGRPENAGDALQIVNDYADRLPILGVCLGHQILATAFGAKVAHAPELVHGKSSRVYHDGTGLFAGLPAPLNVGRYHSLTVEESSLTQNLRVTAFTTKAEVMAIEHRELPLFGLQFHPESILTNNGAGLLGNFLRIGAQRKELAA